LKLPGMFWPEGPQARGRKTASANVRGRMARLMNPSGPEIG